MRFSLITYLLLAFVLFSCNKENAPDCFQRAGEVKTITRSLDVFSEMELRDYIQYELYDSSAYFVEITAPGNLIPDVRTEVKNGKLFISNENTCNFVRSFKNRIHVRVYAPDFSHIENYSTGDITCINELVSPVFRINNRSAAGRIELNLQTDTAYLSTHTGVSDMYVRGSSQVTQVFSQGLGVVDARDLVTTDVFVNNSSINDVYVNTNGYFFALIEYSGNIFYSGTPNHIDSDLRGEGRLIEIP